MKNAMELNAIAVRVVLSSENKKLNTAIAYADNDLSITLEEASKRGLKSLWTKKPKRIKWKYVRAYLEQCGYSVNGLFNYCRIKW